MIRRIFIMQHRMKTHQLSEEQIHQLLGRSQTGSLTTLNSDGTPYIIPIHFVYYKNAIFAHGLPKGKKIDNISNDARVGFCVYEMDKLLLDPNGNPCDTNTKSIINLDSGAKLTHIQVPSSSVSVLGATFF